MVNEKSFRIPTLKLVDMFMKNDMDIVTNMVVMGMNMVGKKT